MKIRILFLMLILALSAGFSELAAQNQPASPGDFTRWVNPFIGTGAKPNSLSGSVFPGACHPFGLVQLSPDEYVDPEEPASCYGYEKNTIFGFSHTHLNGTGVGDLYDVLIMPTTGEIKTEPGDETRPGSGYGSRFRHETEAAGPGYYAVTLDDYKIRAELTATSHTGMHRYTFPRDARSHVIIDLNYSVDKKRPYRVCRIITASMKAVDDHTIEGYRVITGWSRLRKVYFVAQFSKPFKSVNFYSGKREYENIPLINGINLRAAVNFSTEENEQVLVKVGISTVDQEGARNNLNAEIKDWDFDGTMRSTKNEWNKLLSSIQIEGPDELKQTFYTALYRNFIQPNNIADVDGRYIAPDYSVKTAPSGRYYSTFSLWDTYRAAHPLYTIIQPQMDAAFISSMIAQQEIYGYLPIWHLWGDDNYCMIGNHSISVIADAMGKGIKGFDYEKAYEACRASSTIDHLNSPWTVLNKFGYMPEDLQTQSVSITLELAFNDWCMAKMAKMLHKDDDEKFFASRSESYKKLYDSTTSFFRAKDSRGRWMTPFDPLQYGANGGFPFTEGNAWQYFWYVPQDVNELMRLVGGKEKFAAKLDTFFTLNALPGEVNNNASGFIGQYAHGNEPSHHVVYLYNWAGEPWKAQYYSSKVQNELYNNTVYGLCGNEDCGQMSAWFILSAMGFYPVNPSDGVYAVGSPSIPKAVISAPGGKSFVITAKNAGKDNPYVQSVRLNGKAYNKTWLLHGDIMAGGTLEFVMGPKPNKKWGTGKDSAPPDIK